MVRTFICCFSRIIIILFFLIFCSCVESEMPRRRLVVEGWIESGAAPVVMLILPYRPGEDYSVENTVARPAKVILQEGGRQWQLIGMYDSAYFPPYVYTTYEMRGEAGKSYRLAVYYDGLEAYAETEILDPPSILGLTLSDDPSDSQYRKLTLQTSALSGSYDCLMTFLRTEASGKRPAPSYLGVARIPPGKDAVSLEVLRPKFKPDTVPYYSAFRVGETVEVHLCRLTPSAYDFWMDFQNAMSLGHSPLISSSYTLRSNMTGDGIGYFFGYGADRKVIKIE